MSNDSSSVAAIRTARVPQRLAGTPRLRQGLERWLGDCDPARHGLPPDAIVLVRRLATRWTAVIDPDMARRYAPLAALMAGARRAVTADADVDVVWFADEAELLACIARDALSFAWRERWWWRALRAGLPAGAVATPALARWLQAPRQMPRAVQRLGAARSVAWLQGVGAAGREQVLEALAGDFSLAPELRAWVMEGVSLPDLVPGFRQDLALSIAETVAIRPNAAESNSPAERLHHLCLALAQDPSAAASLRRLRVMVAAFEAPRLESPASRQGDRPAPPAIVQGQVPGAVTARRTDAAETASVRNENPPAVATTKPPLETKRIRFHRTEAPAIKLRASAEEKVHAMAPHLATTHDESLTDAPPRTLLHTRYGGLLFLLNAALQLSLYGDFTQPRQPGLDCPPWRFLLLAGRAWCGPGFIRRDPLWGWLQHRSQGNRQPVPLQVWPQLHARLALALSDEQAPRQAIRHMLGLPARLQDSGERLDLFYPLAELPLAVRLSGLDRDPGWIPAAGCDVRFHFD